MNKQSLWYLFLILSIFLFSFQINPDSHLKEKLEYNERLYETNPEKAYQESKLLLEQAIQEKDVQTELALYERHCLYFSLKLEIKNLIVAAKKLKKVAVDYKDIRYEAVAHVYLSQAYMDNKLYENAIAQYENALKILSKADSNDPSINIIRAHAHTYISNLYVELGDYEKAIEKSKLALKEDLKTEDGYKKNRVLCNGYSNLAGIYIEVNLDSAEYYLQKSIELASSDDLKGFNTYLLHNHIFGDIFYKRNNLEKALVNYRIAEKIGYSDPMNNQMLYKAFIRVYEKTGDTQNIKIYKQKLKDIQLAIYGEKYESMHQILEDKETTGKYSSFLIISFISTIILSLSFVYLSYRNKKKNNLLIQTEEKLKEYIIQHEESTSTEEKILDKQIYDELSDIAVNNNQMFMAAFNNVFPNFTNRLLKINSDLAQTEIEFSAYLKLNFSSKEIAQIKSIQPRSVQNKKHRLRKRLNIPQNIDIYHWFNQD